MSNVSSSSSYRPVLREESPNGWSEADLRYSGVHIIYIKCVKPSRSRWTEHVLLRPGSLEQVRPLLCTEELRVEVPRELRVAEPRRVVVGHEADALRVGGLLTLPVPPEPLALKRGDGEHPPVDENAQLGLVVPWGQRSAVQTAPISGVSSRRQRN